MKKIYLFSLLMIANFVANAQITATTYKGAFAPAPTAMWTDSWTNFDPQNTVYPSPASATSVTANITSDVTWATGTNYILQGQIYVTNGATLTIQPGVVVFGAPGALASSLIITKGSKINAVGTPTQPIVFTSTKTPGLRSVGDWGGIILLGKSNFNISGGSPVTPGINNIEGITASALTEYGGGASPDLADNSGTLKYVRIEFGGYVFATDKEINGLTMGAVGSGTTIDYIQVSYINDDAFEWFGGSVNCSHLVAFRSLDDDWDTDNGFSGNVQFCLGVRDPQIADQSSSSTSNGFESDNNGSSTDGTSFTTCTFSNVTEIGPYFRPKLTNGQPANAKFGRMAQLRRNTRIKILNSVLMDYDNGIHIDGYATVVGATSNTELNASNGFLQYKNNILVNSTKPIYVNTPTLALPNTNIPLLNAATWYSSNNNTNATVLVNTTNPILVKPYDSDANVYTGLDYRPVVGGPADLSGTLATTSFNVEDKTNKFNVYPNSFANTFKLSFSTTSTENAIVSVYTIEGKLVENRTVSASDINDVELGSSYAKGVYFVKIKQGQNLKVTRAIKK
jgi:hypothetical protein